MHTLVWLSAALAAGRYVLVAVETVGYPFQLEWMEGGVVDTVARLRAGEPIYAAPSVDFVGHVYPPVYLAVTALASIPAGVGLGVARAVSFVSFAGACAVAYDFVRAETGARWLGAGAAGLLVSTFGASGYWFHLARVDSLHLFLLLSGLHVLLHGGTHRSAVAAGLLGCVATLTKQTALLALVPVLLGLAASMATAGGSARG